VKRNQCLCIARPSINRCQCDTFNLAACGWLAAAAAAAAAAWQGVVEQGQAIGIIIISIEKPAHHVPLPITHHTPDAKIPHPPDGRSDGF
jgi:hypothetical protein